MDRMERMQQSMQKIEARIGYLEKKNRNLAANIAELKAKRKKLIWQKDTAEKLLTAGLLFSEAGVLEDYDREAVLEFLRKQKEERRK